MGTEIILSSIIMILILFVVAGLAHIKDQKNTIDNLLKQLHEIDLNLSDDEYRINRIKKEIGVMTTVELLRSLDVLDKRFPYLHTIVERRLMDLDILSKKSFIKESHDVSGRTPQRSPREP